MEDLAPDITRQRLLIEGYFDIGVDATVIADYLHALAARWTCGPTASPRSSPR
jgi:hypothetical protein